MFGPLLKLLQMGALDKAINISCGIRDAPVICHQSREGVVFVSVIASIMTGLPPATRVRRLVVALKAYIDDSGNDGKSPVFILAGFLARSEEWAIFSNKWKEILSREGLPYFKMSDRNKRPRLSVRVELATLIKSHAIANFSLILFYEDYQKIHRLSLSEFRSPYFVAYHAIISIILNSMVDVGMREKVHFIFDEQLHASDRVQAVWSKLTEIIYDDLRPLIGGRPSHRNDKEVLPLQGADLLAWHVRQNYAAMGRDNQRKLFG
jgi:hypothetical protein